MQHTIAPVFDNSSRVLILGSFPSVKSRETGFFYGNPQNRFWRVLSALLECDVPNTIEEKRVMLLRNKVAIWDVIASCDINGSDDATIRNVVPNNLKIITDYADIKCVFTNGGTADKLYKKYCLAQTELPTTRLPSTSPANAGYDFISLIDAWNIVGKSITK